MAKVTVGGMKFKDYAAKKPVMIMPTGEFVSAKEIVSTPTLALGTMYSLSEDLQVELTLKRIEMEPNFKIAIFGEGIVSKGEILKHVKDRTEMGEVFVQAEMTYCNEIMAELAGGETQGFEPIPKPRPEPIPPDWKWVPRDWWKKLVRWFRCYALFCENTTDAVTKFAAAYRKKNVHSAFRARGFGVYVLEGVNNVRANFVPLAERRTTLYICGIGHGSPTTYTGHLNSPILHVCSYDPKEVKGKVFHLLSCQTAKQLGPDLISKGAAAYAGYFENFTFIYDQPQTPVNEMELFWKCDSTFDIMMASGASVEEAHNRTIHAYNAAIASVPNTVAATWLTWDRNYFRSPVIDAAYGDKNVRISPWVKLPIFLEQLDETRSRFEAA